MDIGTLTGTLVLEDKLSQGLTLAGRSITDFSSKYLKQLTSTLDDASKSLTGLAEAAGGSGGLNAALGAAGMAAGAASVAVTGVAVAATAAVAAVGALTTATILLGNRGSDVNDVAATFQNFSGTVDNANKTLEALRKGTLNTVTDFDLMQSSSKLLAGGVKLTADQFGTLSSAAFVLQNQGLGPTKDMLQLVSQALLTGQTRLLQRSIGLIDTAKAEKEYAKSIGVERLTQMQKKEADRLAILDALNKKVKDAGVQNRDFGESMEAAIVAIKNWGDQLAGQVAASPHVIAAVDNIGKALSEAFGLHSKTAMEATLTIINKFADGVAKYAPIIIEQAGRIADNIVKGWEILSSGYNRFIKPMFADLDKLKADALANGPKTNLQVGNLPIGGLNLPQTKGFNVVGFGSDQNKPGALFAGPGVTMSGTGTGVPNNDESENRLTEQQKAMAKLLDTIKPLTDAQKNLIEQWREQDKPMALVAKAYGMNEVAVRNYVEELEREEGLRKNLAQQGHKLTLDTLKNEEETRNKIAAIRGDDLDNQFRMRVEYEEKNRQASMQGTELQLYLAKKEHDEAIRLLKGQTDITGEQYDKALDAIETNYATRFFTIKDTEEKITDVQIEEWQKRIANEKTSLQKMGDGFKQLLKNIPQTLADAFTGGGDFTGAIKSIVSQAGAILGSAFGPIGQAVGSMAGALVEPLKKLFGIGPTEYEKRVRAAAEQMSKLKDEVLKSHGGMQQLILDADLVGINIKEAFNWKDPDAFGKVVDDLKSKTDLLNEAMQEYGFTWEDLGDKARTAKLSELFEDLYAKTDILRTAGIDYHTILERQAKDYSELVQAAIRTGTEIPIAMQQTLQDLVDMGELVDENGQAFTDLSKVTWAKTLTQGFDEVKGGLDEVVDSIDHLTAALTGLGNVKIRVPVQVDYPENPDVQYHAGGGIIPPSFSPRGTDTILAAVSPGERITSARDNQGNWEARVVVPVYMDSQKVAEGVVKVARRL